jgi:hypothetical protein
VRLGWDVHGRGRRRWVRQKLEAAGVLAAVGIAAGMGVASGATRSAGTTANNRGGSQHQSTTTSLATTSSTSLSTTTTSVPTTSTSTTSTTSTTVATPPPAPHVILTVAGPGSDGTGMHETVDRFCFDPGRQFGCTPTVNFNGGTGVVTALLTDGTGHPIGGQDVTFWSPPTGTVSVPTDSAGVAYWGPLPPSCCFGYSGYSGYTATYGSLTATWPTNPVARN